jgi:hypothetical protein
MNDDDNQPHCQCSDEPDMALYNKLVALGWQPIECAVCGSSWAAAYPANEVLRKENRELRRMLCSAMYGPKAYMDDGEAQISAPFPIDFIRDSLEDIRIKLFQNAMHELKEQGGLTT